MQSSMSMATLEGRESEREDSEKESCSWHRLMKLVSFRVDIISHLKRSRLSHLPFPLPSLSVSLSISSLAFLCCVMRIFVHSLHGLLPKWVLAVKLREQDNEQEEEAEHKSSPVQERKTFLFNSTLDPAWRQGARRWSKVGRQEDLQCPLAAVSGWQAGWS